MVNHSKRVTIMIDNDNLTNLRKLNAKMIKKNNSSCSFSRVVNDMLLEAEIGLKR